MKTTTIFILLFLLMVSPIAMAQDFMDALKQTAEMHNESRGQNDNNGGLSDQQMEEYRQRWEEKWKGIKEVYEAELKGLNSYSQCFGLILLYSNALSELLRKAESASNCRKKYDFYGLALLAQISSMTILYCPEKLFNLQKGDNDLYNKAANNFVYPQITQRQIEGYTFPQDEFKSTFWGYQLKLWYDPRRIYGNTDGTIDYNLDYTRNNIWGKMFLNDIEYYFKPEAVGKRILKIGQKMEALGCGG